MSEDMSAKSVPFGRPAVVVRGVCPQDGHLLVEVDGQVMHLIPGNQASDRQRAQRYIAEGHSHEVVVEAERLLRAMPGD
ncbi:hypothetical protein [Actinomadura kijaniata]|nr:hypothetical protein [Actinomadura kijaniata]